MPSEIIFLSERAIIAHAPKGGEAALALLQGHPGSGFGLVQGESLLLKLTPDVKFDPQRFWDVRVFNKAGEWHAWRMPDRTWRARTAMVSEWKDCCIHREYALWGTQIKQAGADWYCCWEAGRGTELYLPRLLFRELRERDLPVCLKAMLKIYADEAGVSGIVDSMLCGWS